MKTNLIRFLITLMPLGVAAQIPNTLLHSLLAPAETALPGSGSWLGYSVSVDGEYTVVGAPYNDLGAMDAGVVKVFSSTNGALLFLLPNPSPATGDNFGYSVAISGSRIVVGARFDDTGTSDAGSAYLYELNGSAPTVPVLTFNNPSPAVGDSFGRAVAISGTRVVIGAMFDDTGAADAGSAYVYDLSGGPPTVPVFTLNNPGPAAGDNFGRSVSISGTRVVVGADSDDTGATNAGTAYVYNISSGTPTVPAVTLNNPSPAAEDHFGDSVSISGTLVVVSAWGDDTGATDAGSAYVYNLSSGTPAVPTVTLNNPSPAAQDYFGGSVSISGTRVVVGDDGDDTGATDAGSAFVYELASGTPAVPVLTLNNPNPAAQDYFGLTVSISGSRIVVGSPLDNTAASDAGSAYLYVLAGGTPTVPVATLNNLALLAGDLFGHSVAVSGNLMVVGAYADDSEATDAGKVHVYDVSGGTPTIPVLTLNNPSPEAHDQFGISVAISGTRVVVGATYDGTGGNRAGSVYAYDLSSGTPTVPVATLTNPDPASDDIFGSSVAIDGTRVVVGAYLDDTGANNSGSAYVYDLNSGTPSVPVATLNNPSPAEEDLFGYPVAISGTRVLVGAYQDDTGATDAGSVYVYDLSSGTPSVPVLTLNNPGPAELDNFGISAAISGTRVVVGAGGDDTGTIDAGSVYVYDVSSGTPTVPVITLNNPSPAAQDYFGHAAAISGMRVVVGAFFDDTGANDAGSAYVYDLGGDTPAVPVATLHNPSPAAQDSFGRSVAIDGTIVLIGTSEDDTVAVDKGAAYVFGPHTLDQDSDGLLDSWEQLYWPGMIALHGALDDDDHDGLVNLLELAFGLNPTLPSAGGLPPVANEGGFMTMTITKQPGASYQVQSAGTLLPSLPDSFSASSTTVLINDATTLKVRDNTLFGTPPARFMRVQVTGAP